MTAARDDLVTPIIAWIDAVDATDILNAPEDFLASYGAVCRSIARLLETGDAAHAPSLLTALAACEFVLAEAPSFTGKAGLPPLQPLPAAWLGLVDDGSAEFRLAAALNALRPAGLDADSGEPARIRPFRSHLEPIDYHFRPDEVGLGTTSVAWDFTAHGEVAWDRESDVDGLNAIFTRRLKLFADDPGGFLADPIRARAADINAFLEGQTDEALLSRYAFELALIDLWRLDHDPFGGADDEAAADPAWALARRCYTGAVPLNRDIHLLAARGDLDTALQFARAHLRKHGQEVPDAEVASDVDARRLAAALLL